VVSLLDAQLALTPLLAAVCGLRAPFDKPGKGDAPRLVSTFSKGLQGHDNTLSQCSIMPVRPFWRFETMVDIMIRKTGYRGMPQKQQPLQGLALLRSPVFTPDHLECERAFAGGEYAFEFKRLRQNEGLVFFFPPLVHHHHVECSLSGRQRRRTQSRCRLIWASDGFFFFFFACRVNHVPGHRADSVRSFRQVAALTPASWVLEYRPAVPTTCTPFFSSLFQFTP
jgi:hypothetical protein